MTSPAQPSETQHVFGTAMYMLGAIGIIASLCGIVIGVVVLAIALLFGMLQTPAGTFNWPILAPLGGALAIGVLSWLVIKIGGRLRR